jgi:hypothetical protein
LRTSLYLAALAGFIDSPPTRPYNGLRFLFHHLLAPAMVSFSKDNLAKMVSGLKAGLKHAFAVTHESEALSVDDLALLERVADAVVARGMAAPATVFLESAGPMNFLGSQALHFLTPILDLACKTSELERIARLLERRDAIPCLIALIEAKSAPQGTSSR